jgi:hypothetical protein
MAEVKQMAGFMGSQLGSRQILSIPLKNKLYRDSLGNLI